VNKSSWPRRALAVVATGLFLSGATVEAADVEKLPEVRIAFPARDVYVVAEVADSHEQRVRGLGGRDGLPAGHAMLFTGMKEDRAGIWMKDMRFAIDVLWFDCRLRLVSVAENVVPESWPRMFHPARPAQYILEVPAGFIARYRIAVGDSIVFDRETGHAANCR
jgi:uncharacterized membrane protein (UPF0127 family)